MPDTKFVHDNSRLVSNNQSQKNIHSQRHADDLA